MNTESDDRSSPLGEPIPLALIVAMARNRVIGRGNAMPWHLPAELKRFKQLTLGKPILMGRKTHESIGRVLPGRPNIVVSRRGGDDADDLQWCGDIKQALQVADREARLCGADEIMVIGGAQIYEALLPQVETLYITEIELEPEGDAFFPPIDAEQWRLIEQSPGQEAMEGVPAWRTLRYKRRSNN